MCVYACTSCSEFFKETESGFPLQQPPEAICCAVLSADDDFFVRLGKGPEGHGRSIKQDLD